LGNTAVTRYFLHVPKLAKVHSLRGYDAVQLASALEVENELTSLNLPNLIFVSADNELNNAAKSEGLTVQLSMNFSLRYNHANQISRQNGHQTTDHIEP
jgi:hypothetical protein